MTFKLLVCFALLAIQCAVGRDDGLLLLEKFRVRLSDRRLPMFLLGYVYVMVDDTWSEMQRDSKNRLVPHKERFPSGIKGLADYVHSKGLKIGIYGDVGPRTCGGYPGSNGKNDSGDYYDIDAKTFAEWGIDALKFDGCDEDTKRFDDLYPKMGKLLNATGRPMVYICEWPLYQKNANYSAVANTCHVYRNAGDIQQTWQSVQSIINFYGDNNDLFSKYSGPGHFFDPGRPIVYICEWPLYQEDANYSAVVDTCHVFRNYGDITQTWQSILPTINFYGDNNALFSKYSGPGHFFDPDMIVVGDYGMSHEQSRTQMAMWAMFSAPLYMSNDLREISPEDKKVLQNKAIIAVNQDKNGIMAKRVSKANWEQVWTKKVEPQVNGQWSYAVVYMDSDGIGDKHYMSQKVSTLIPEAKPTTEYVVHDLFQDEGK
ncbi:unnamed protein product, partial [Oppiella nova]